MSIFNPHSTRSASVSAVKVPIGTILKTAGWSKDCTFRKFYKKPVTDNMQFAESILQRK